MKLLTTRTFKGDLTLTTKDRDGHILRPGNIVREWCQTHCQLLESNEDLIITQIYKNGNIVTRKLHANHMPQGTQFYVTHTIRFRGTDVIYTREQS